MLNCQDPGKCLLGAATKQQNPETTVRGGAEDWLKSDGAERLISSPTILLLDPSSATLPK